MSIEENKAVVRHFFADGWGKRNLALADTLFAPDFASRPVLVPPVIIPPGYQPTAAGGPAFVKQTLALWWHGFSDGQMLVRDLFAEGDRVVARTLFRGTHDGLFWGFQPMSRAVAVPFISIYRLAAGQIAEEWQFFDALTLLQHLGILPGDDPPPPDGDLPSPPRPGSLILPAAENKAVLRRYYEEAVNGGQWDLLPQLISDTYLDYSSGAPQPFSAAQMREVLADWNVAFPTSHYTIEDAVAEGDRALVRLTWQAVHAGEFQGLPPTGRSLRLGQVVIATVSERKIAERWSILDRLGLMQQLGLISVGPPEGHKPPAARPPAQDNPQRWSKDPGKAT